MTNQIIRFYAIWLRNLHLFARELLQKRVEILQLGVLNDHFAPAVMVLDMYLKPECSLQLLLDFAHIRDRPEAPVSVPSWHSARDEEAPERSFQFGEQKAKVS